MSLAHETAPTDLAPTSPPGATGFPPPARLAPPPAAAAGPRALPGSGARKGGRGYLLAAGVGFLALAGGIAALMYARPSAARPDVLLHVVKREPLNVLVTEKGTVESADNKDVICMVKAGSKGQGGYSTSIKWVIDDGSKVEPGQLLMILDDSALQDQARTQRIAVDTAYAAKVKAEKDYEIAVKENEKLIAVAANKLLVADIDLEKFFGLAPDPALAGRAAVLGGAFGLAEAGDYRRQVDDATGKMKQAESDLEQYRERAAHADRMVKQKYMSDAQAQAERSKMLSAVETLRSQQAALDLLVKFDRRKLMADLRSKVEDARLEVKQNQLKAEASEVSALIEKRTKTSVHTQEVEKLKEIEDQIKECRVYAPQKGMVVYFVNESGRFGSTPQGMIEQGAQVKEGQKMLRIPNLEQMQVNTKVHEAMYNRIKGDERVATGLVDRLRVGMLSVPDPFARLVSQHADFIDEVRRIPDIRDHEYKTIGEGQRATVRVDSQPGKLYQARVKSVAGVASQTDSWISDVKLYQTLVLIEGDVNELRPGMTAEVAIQVRMMEDVLTVPLQAVVGGAELGAKRKVYVRAGGEYVDRDVTLGGFNDRMVEIKDGLQEGDEVVINPSKLMTADNKAKARDGAPAGGGKGEYGGKGGDGAGGEGGWKKGGGGKGMKGGGMKGGPPGGGPPAGG